MTTLIFYGLNNLNTSLQVGDLVYSHSTQTQTGAEDAEGLGNTGSVNIIGTLLRITFLDNGIVELDIDEDAFPNTVNVSDGDFIMFSKYDQSIGDLIGYYAKVRFVNDSRKKAEIFSVGSEVIINSK